MIEPEVADLKRERFRLRTGLSIECGDGWLGLIENGIEFVDFLSKKLNVKVKYTQIKEKYGELRLYYTSEVPDDVYGTITSDIVSELIGLIEDASRYICENCGERGSMRYDGGWYTTLCDVCDGGRSAKVGEVENV